MRHMHSHGAQRQPLPAEERSRLLELAVRRADQSDDALTLALSRIEQGWGFASAVAAVRGHYGSAASDAVERQLADAVLRQFGRRK